MRLSLRAKFLLCFLPLCITVLGQGFVAKSNRYYDQALDAFRARDYHETIVLLDSSLMLQESADAFYLRARVYEALNLPIRALSDYESVVRKDPSFSEAYFSKGIIYLQFNNAEQALSDFNYLLDKGSNGTTRSVLFEVDPTGGGNTSILTMESMRARLYNYRAQAYQKHKKYDLALEDYEKSLALELRADTYVNRGVLKVEMGQQTAAATDFEKAIAIDQFHELAWYNLVLIRPAIDLPEEILENADFAPTLNVLAVKAMEEGDTRRAIQYFNIALDKNEDALTLLNRGRVLMKVGEFSAARKDFAKARYLDPNRVESFYLIGNTYFRDKQFDKALAYYNQYLVIDPTHAMTWYNTAMAHFELEEMGEGCHCLRRAYDMGMKKASQMEARLCVEEN